jgi:hypothetical protein
MSQLRSIGKESVSEREVFVLSVSDVASLLERFSLPSPHFVALLALDASVVEDDAIRHLAKNLLCSGCVFFTAWGPDCERVHDLFDSVANFYEPLIMTTWEHDEPLDQAIWNFLYVTHPDEDYWDTCRSSVAITVGNVDWSAQIERRLRDMDALNRDVVT